MYGFFMLDLVINPLLLKDHKSQIEGLFLLLCLLVVAMLLTLGVGEQVLLAMPMPKIHNLDWVLSSFVAWRILMITLYFYSKELEWFSGCTCHQIFTSNLNNLFHWQTFRRGNISCINVLFLFQSIELFNENMVFFIYSISKLVYLCNQKHDGIHWIQYDGFCNVKLSWCCLILLTLISNTRVGH